MGKVPALYHPCQVLALPGDQRGSLEHLELLALGKGCGQQAQCQKATVTVLISVATRWWEGTVLLL